MSKVEVSELKSHIRIFKNSDLGSFLKLADGMIVVEIELSSFSDFRKIVRISPIGLKVLENLRKITGIERIFFKKEEIIVVIGLAFDWKEIEGQVIYALEALSKKPDAELFFENKKLSPICIIEKSSENSSLREYHFNILLFPVNYSQSKGEIFAIDKVIGELIGSCHVGRFLIDRYSIIIEKRPLPPWQRTPVNWDGLNSFLNTTFQELYNTPIEFEYIGRNREGRFLCLSNLRKSDP